MHCSKVEACAHLREVPEPVVPHSTLGPTLLESVKMRAAILMTLLRERRDELPTLNSRVLVIQAASRPDEEDVAHGVAPA